MEVDGRVGDQVKNNTEAGIEESESSWDQSDAVVTVGGLVDAQTLQFEDAPMHASALELLKAHTVIEMKSDKFEAIDSIVREAK